MSESMGVPLLHAEWDTYEGGVEDLDVTRLHAFAREPDSITIVAHVGSDGDIWPAGEFRLATRDAELFALRLLMLVREIRRPSRPGDGVN